MGGINLGKVPWDIECSLQEISLIWISGVCFLQLEASALLRQCYEKQLKGDLESEAESASPRTQTSWSSCLRLNCHQYPLSSCFLSNRTLNFKLARGYPEKNTNFHLYCTKLWQRRCEQLLERVLNGNVLVSKQKSYYFFQTLNKLEQIIRSLCNNWKSREIKNQGSYQGFYQLKVTHWLDLRFAGDMPKL